MDDRSGQPLTDSLTQRELEILRLIAEGLSNQDIADRLVLSPGTVKWYLKQIYSKLDVSSRTQAVAAARAAGLLDPAVAKVEPSMPPHNLLHQPTSFVGRDKELTAIARRLQDPTCRLLTVVGPGGIGKTRLALQAAEPQIAAYADGVFFVSLAPLSVPESIVSAIGEAIHFSFYPGPEPRQQLLDYLRAKHMLLVLDNFEHLLAAASLAADILAAAPKVRVLATSRERLNLQAETIFSLDGMAYPAQKFADDAAGYGAVKLFLQSAAQVQPDFTLTAGNVEAVTNICRQVQGMPLGLLLAASWVGMLSVQEIVQEMQKSLDFLEANQRDMPERQRSLRAAFDHSWKLLTDDERDVFKRLSVFRGGFTREAAQEVGGASLKTLMSLVNKSLLRRDSVTGRYEIHELLRQFGDERLDASPQEGERAHELHCVHYTGYMQRQWKAMMSLRQGAVLDEIGIEFNNVREAWDYAVEMRRADYLRNMAFSLDYFCDKRTDYSEPRAMFGRAVDALKSLSPGPETEITRGLMLTLQGLFVQDHFKSIALVEESLVVLRGYDCPEETAFALFNLALKLGFGFHRFAEGEQAAREGLRIAQANQIEWLTGHCLLQLGVCLRGQGDLNQARHYGEESFRVSSAIGDVWAMAANALILLGVVAMDLGNYAEAERHFQQGVQWYQELESGGFPWAVGYGCARLAEVGLKTQDYAKADYWLRQSLTYLAKAARGKDRTYYEAIHDLCALFAAQGRAEDAVEMLAQLCVVQYDGEAQTIRNLAIDSLSDFQALVPADSYAAAVERGKTLDLDAVVAEFLVN